MEFFEKYVARLESKGINQEVLEELRQEAAQSLVDDPPEKALTLTGQLVAALRQVVQRQNPTGLDAIYTVNAIIEMMIQHLWELGWHMRAVKTENGWVYKRLPA